MEDPNITMEEYIHLEIEKALRRGQVFNWETATYGKVSSEPTVNPEHDIKDNFDFEISFAESDDEDYTFTYAKNSFSYKLIFVNDLKLDTDNDDDKINVKLSSEDISIEPLDNVIKGNFDTYSYAFDENIETNHDTPDMALLPPMNLRHPWLIFEGQNYTNEDIHDFEDRLGKIYDRQMHRAQLLDFNILTEEMGQTMTDRLRMEHIDAQGATCCVGEAE
ncbi:hypothetical protein Tco_1201902 [Tanacetum coccineum]